MEEKIRVQRRSRGGIQRSREEFLKRSSWNLEKEHAVFPGLILVDVGIIITYFNILLNT